jgi:hypothetical protein
VHVVAHQIDQAAVNAIAEALRRRASVIGIGAFTERKALEPATVQALTSVFGAAVEKSRKVSIPCWASVGQVDIVVRASNVPGTYTYQLLGELKWCGSRKGDILYESIWDGFKMALGTLLPERPRAYLLTGAPPKIWDTSQFADIYETKTHDPHEWCDRRLGGRKNYNAWDELLKGGYDRWPDAVPATLKSTIVGRASVGGWELRAVEITTDGRASTPFSHGWPNGRRPLDARRPL